MSKLILFFISFTFISLAAMSTELSKVGYVGLSADTEIPAQVNFLNNVYQFAYHAISEQVIKSKNSCCTKTSLEYTFSCAPKARYQLPPLHVIIQQYSNSPVISYKVSNQQDKSLAELAGAYTITTANSHGEIVLQILQKVLFDMLHHYCLAFTIRKCCECFGKLHDKDVFDARIFLSCGHIFHLTCITKQNDAGNYTLASKCPVCRKKITREVFIGESKCVHPTVVFFNQS